MSNTPAVAMLAPNEADREIRNHTHAPAFGTLGVRIRFHAMTIRRSTDTGYAHAFQPPWPAASAMSWRWAKDRAAAMAACIRIGSSRRRVRMAPRLSGVGKGVGPCDRHSRGPSVVDVRQGAAPTGSL